MRRAAKRDENEKIIVDALEAVGFHVWRLDSPADLLVWKRGGHFQMLEVKMPKARRDKRQVEQQKFLELTKTPVVRNADQALAAVGIKHT